SPRCVVGSIVHGDVCRERIVAGDDVVKARQAKIFPDPLPRIRVGEGGSIGTVESVGRRPEGVGILEYLRLQIGDRQPIRQKTLAGKRSRHNRYARNRQPLLELFVVPEQEHLVLLERASQSSSKLMAFEGRSSIGLIEEVAGIKSAVAQI